MGTLIRVVHEVMLITPLFIGTLISVLHEVMLGTSLFSMYLY